MAMSLSWAPIDGALITAGSRQSSINLLWRMVPDAERTPVRRKLVIALVDHVREHHERTGYLAPGAAADAALDVLARVAAGSLVTPSRTDKQPAASPSETKGGLGSVGPAETNPPDLVTHHEET